MHFEAQREGVMRYRFDVAIFVGTLVERQVRDFDLRPQTVAIRVVLVNRKLREEKIPDRSA